MVSNRCKMAAEGGLTQLGLISSLLTWRSGDHGKYFLPSSVSNEIALRSSGLELWMTRDQY